MLSISLLLSSQTISSLQASLGMQSSYSVCWASYAGVGWEVCMRGVAIAPVIVQASLWYAVVAYRTTEARLCG
jgi:NADH:ubiquinone oxidoreductase subunit 4 (subunit M)